MKRGDSVFSNLFDSILEEIFCKLGWEGKGLKLNSKWLSNLLFADDMVLIALDAKELQEMTNDLCNESKKAGLLINDKKTVLITNYLADSNLVIEESKVMICQKGTYPGQIISFQNNYGKELSKRKSNKWKSFWSLKEIYKSTGVVPK